MEVKRIFDVVVPQRLLYIAVDGVAPRAKLNQQRARRFKSSRERLQALQSATSTAATISAFDSNCITPGTEFMSKLSIALKYFIEHQMKTDARWANITIFFSGSEVPGEGEHKIVTYIREARVALDYCPNLRHCILGSDADMIMLALATHEPYFLVLRESVQFNFKPKHKYKNKSKNSDSTATTNNTTTTSTPTKKNKIMNYIYINILREYIINELLENLNKFDFNTERILDDFVFLTFFVGNDFLPSLPALNINDDAFELIFDAYKTLLSTEPEYYLIEEGNIKLDRLEVILSLIGANEKSLFFDQYLMNALKVKQKETKRKMFEKETISIPSPIESNEKEEFSTPATNMSSTNLSEVSSLEYSDGIVFTPADDTPAVGEILNEDECRANYYREKLDIDVDSAQGPAQLGEVVRAYLLGLQWCLRYYSTGCCSWSWFYPYHYGPFLCDLTGLAAHPALDVAVQLDSPLQPFQSLLACLPQASSVLLPECYASLMCSERSPLYAYYPIDFATDMNGKRQEYEAVVLLPFIDLPVLLGAEREFVSSTQLTAEEQSRNKFGVVYKYSKECTATGTTTATAATINIKEISPSFAPSAPFTAQLLPGTVPTSTSLPGFPSHAQALARVDYSRGYNKKYKHKKNRKNCYDSSPGLTDSSLPDVSNLSLSMQPRDTGNSSSSIGIADISSSRDQQEQEQGEQLVLVVDDQTSLFLGALAQQVQLQSADFISINHSSAATAAAGTVYTLQFSLSAHTDASSDTVPACWASLRSSDVLAKAGLIYGPVRGVLQPAVLVSMGGAVSVKYVDTSHIGQLEEFLLHRVCGAHVLDACLSGAQSSSSSATSGERVKSSSVSGLESTGLGFQRSIRIGTYTGSSAADFADWLTQELYRLQSHLPVFSAAALEHSGPDPDSDSGRVVLNTVELVG